MIIVAAVALQAQFCECEELLPGRAVRLAPVRAWQVLFYWGCLYGIRLKCEENYRKNILRVV